MAVLFSRVDFSEFKHYLSQMDPVLFIVAILFFVPQVAISAYRWRLMIQKNTRISLWESAQLILSASALNILLPSRVGDLSKAYFVGKGGQLQLKRGMNVVLFEKYIDLAALGVVILTGVLWTRRWDEPSLVGLSFALSMIAIFPVFYFLNLERWLSGKWFERHPFLQKLRNFLLDSQAYLNEVKKDSKQLLFILALSIFLWFVHIFQFYLIFRSLHSQASLFNVFRLVPLAILVGLLPITIAGVGTRDSAMVFLFAPYEKASLMVGVGLFASLRYFIPGILGLPFLNRYIVKDASAK